jgi:hypothetical protein
MGDVTKQLARLAVTVAGANHALSSFNSFGQQLVHRHFLAEFLLGHTPYPTGGGFGGGGGGGGGSPGAVDRDFNRRSHPFGYHGSGRDVDRGSGAPRGPPVPSPYGFCGTAASTLASGPGSTAN